MDGKGKITIVSEFRRKENELAAQGWGSNSAYKVLLIFFKFYNIEANEAKSWPWAIDNVFVIILSVHISLVKQMTVRENTATEPLPSWQRKTFLLSPPLPGSSLFQLGSAPNPGILPIPSPDSSPESLPNSARIYTTKNELHLPWCLSQAAGGF